MVAVSLKKKKTKKKTKKKQKIHEYKFVDNNESRYLQNENIKAR